ncbi:MAG TPA: hypothetical protein VM093_09055 [Aeromicrobium sp.]|nr:hypothetical protein [Aeromicrobium sp.]
MARRARSVRRTPTVVSLVAAMYAPVMLVLERVLDSAEHRRECALRDELARLRTELRDTGVN